MNKLLTDKSFDMAKFAEEIAEKVNASVGKYISFGEDVDKNSPFPSSLIEAMLYCGDITRDIGYFTTNGFFPFFAVVKPTTAEAVLSMIDNIHYVGGVSIDGSDSCESIGSHIVGYWFANADSYVEIILDADRRSNNLIDPPRNMTKEETERCCVGEYTDYDLLDMGIETKDDKDPRFEYYLANRLSDVKPHENSFCYEFVVALLMWAKEFNRLPGLTPCFDVWKMHCWKNNVLYDREDVANVLKSLDPFIEKHGSEDCIVLSDDGYAKLKERIKQP